MAYTAAEMRDESEWIAHTGNDLWALGHVTTSEAERIGKISAMLRQAADAMDRQKALDELASESQRLGLYDVQRPATTKEGE